MNPKRMAEGAATLPVRGPAVWPGFVCAAWWLAASAGFSLGAALFAVPTLGLPIGPWWPAAAQVHGHIQLFGWAALMVLGVGLHFLPRLRGAALPHPALARPALALLVAGLVLRALCQPILALADSGTLRAAILEGLLVGSGALEFAGATLVLGLLAGALRQGPPLRTRAGLWPVLPFLLTAFSTYWAALAVNLAGLVATHPSTGGLVPDRFDELGGLLAFYGFLIPISVAMSERTFPLYFRTPRPQHRLLGAGLVLLLAGLSTRIGGMLADSARASGLGEMGLAAALGLFMLALGIFAPRRPLPRQPVRPFRDPIQLHAISAYLWLVVAVLLLGQDGLAALGFPCSSPPVDAERHVLGTGFVTLLILGLGAHLLPSFANRRLRHRSLVWTTLALGNLAALLRVGPLLLPAIFPTGSAVEALAGITALVALIAFAVNVPMSAKV